MLKDFLFFVGVLTVYCWIARASVTGTHFFDKKLVYKELVLGQPNGKETFDFQAMEVNKLKIFLSFSYYNFGDTATQVKNNVFICFLLSNPVFFLSVVRLSEKCKETARKL